MTFTGSFCSIKINCLEVKGKKTASDEFFHLFVFCHKEEIGNRSIKSFPKKVTSHFTKGV